MNISHLILNSSIAQGLDIIGDRWSLLILREAFYGYTRFEDLIKHTGASRATLTRRLAALIDNKILYKRPVTPGSNRYEYCFTQKGAALASASLLAQQWDSLRSPNKKNKATLVHTHCNHELEPKAVCRHCRQELLFDDVSWAAGKSQLHQQLDVIRSIQQQRRVRESKQVNADTNDLVYLIGDRWTLLILIVSFFGTCRYDDYLKQLNIAPGILSGRLKTMVSGDILKTALYQEHPPRHEYKLTEKGKSIFPFIMTLRQWASEQISKDTASQGLIHQPCGHALEVDVECGHCHSVPKAEDIQLLPCSN